MSGQGRWAARVVLAGGLVVATGCGGTARPEPTAVEYFRDKQGPTVTPYGRILIGSVEERDGLIEYTTEDGKRWRVRPSKRADGTYEYGTPDEVR